MSASSATTDIQSISSSMENDALTPIGLSAHESAKTTRHLLDFVNRLHDFGISQDIDLPRIVAIGPTSAGKSSLVESLTGVALPRAAGVCTRGPIEVRLSHSTDPWQCDISLLFLGREEHGTSERRRVPFGGTIYDPTEFKERMRRAPSAILNPSTSAKHWLTANEIELTKREVSFTRNHIVLEISGPDIADLSFIDIPGLIASGDPNEMNMIEEMAIQFISQPSCVILLTVPCETSFENQKAWMIVREHDPEGKRTIGVLTKPDRIETGQHSEWFALIKNEDKPLDHKWHCIKQPSWEEVERGITHPEAGKEDLKFFADTALWKDLPSRYRKQLGRDNLVDKLGHLLCERIAERHPYIKKEIEAALRETKADLDALGTEPSSNPQIEIATMLQAFTNNLYIEIAGIQEKDCIIQQIHQPQNTFKAAIRSTRPDFRPFEAKSYESVRTTVTPPEETSNRLVVAIMDDIRRGHSSDTIWINQVMDKAELARNRQLPGNYPYSVKLSYISEFTQKWAAPAHQLCQVVYEICSKFVKDLITKHFQAFGRGLLEKNVIRIVLEYLEQCKEKAMNSIESHLETEFSPFTMNKSYLFETKERILTLMRAFRQQELYGGILSRVQGETTPINQVIAILINISPAFQGVTPTDFTKLLPTKDEMDPAIQIMAEVRAYFQVAYKRYTDEIPMAIDRDLVHGLHNGLLNVLNEGLNIYGPDGNETCVRFASERDDVAKQRSELKEKMRRLRDANRQIEIAM